MSEEQQQQKEPELNEFQKYNNAVDQTKLPLFSRAQLQRYNGVDRPEIYVAIRGIIYDVTHNLKSYRPGKAYNRLVGKDASRQLGTNKLQLGPNEQLADDPENTWYTGDLTEKQNQTVDKWGEFFRKRYKIVGLVVDQHDRD